MSLRSECVGVVIVVGVDAVAEADAPIAHVLFEGQIGSGGTTW